MPTIELAVHTSSTSINKYMLYTVSQKRQWCCTL